MGRLGFSCISMRGEALLAKQFCHQMAAGGILADHLAFWLGGTIGYLAPSTAGGHHASMFTGTLVLMAEVLEEIFTFNTISASNPEKATAASIYKAFMDTPPPPRLRPGCLFFGTESGGGYGALGYHHTW
jgi:hypothetical protein